MVMHAERTAMINQGDNLTADINNYINLYRAHSTVHPDRGECGGVGACLMLRTESEAEDGIAERLQRLALEGKRVVVTVQKSSTVAS